MAQGVLPYQYQGQMGGSGMTALGGLPEGVEQVYLRSDTAGYQWDLLSFCARGDNERFGSIEFAVGSDVTAAFKTAVSEVPEEA